MMLRVVTTLLAVAVFVLGYVTLQLALAGPSNQGAAPTTVAPVAAPTSSVPTTTSTTTSTTTTTTTPPVTLPVFNPTGYEAPPPLEPRYLVSSSEVEPEAKQLAVDVAYDLTTYEADDDGGARLAGLGSRGGVELLLQNSGPLMHPGSWSRGQVVYAQMGGLTDERASVMVVVRQTVGSGSDTTSSLVRTLDIRLVRDGSAWAFDFLSSAGGSLDRLDASGLAASVANDPRIQMSDSARLDIESGLVSPVLLKVMAELADQAPYGVVVAATGHPYNVFDTDRQSHHTMGRAIDINWVGDRLVVDDRAVDSQTYRIVQWLLANPDVLQVGSPWDLDGDLFRRSFTDAVHQDHIHLAVRDGS